MNYLCITMLSVLAFTSLANGVEKQTHLFILSGQSNMARLNPKDTFTPTLAAALGKENILVIKDAQGGQPIRRWYKKWKSVQGVAPQLTGDLYERLMKKVRTETKGKT